MSAHLHPVLKLEMWEISVSPLLQARKVEYHVPAVLDDVLVTCPYQLLLTSAELTYFASQIERRSGLAAGFGKPSPVEQCDFCLTEL